MIKNIYCVLTLLINFIYETHQQNNLFSNIYNGYYGPFYTPFGQQNSYIKQNQYQFDKYRASLSPWSNVYNKINIYNRQQVPLNNDGYQYNRPLLGQPLIRSSFFLNSNDKVIATKKIPLQKMKYYTRSNNSTFIQPKLDVNALKRDKFTRNGAIYKSFIKPSLFYGKSQPTFTRIMPYKRQKYSFGFIPLTRRKVQNPFSRVKGSYIRNGYINPYTFKTNLPSYRYSKIPNNKKHAYLDAKTRKSSVERLGTALDLFHFPKLKDRAKVIIWNTKVKPVLVKKELHNSGLTITPTIYHTIDRPRNVSLNETDSQRKLFKHNNDDKKNIVQIKNFSYILEPVNNVLPLLISHNSLSSSTNEKYIKIPHLDDKKPLNQSRSDSHKFTKGTFKQNRRNISYVPHKNANIILQNGFRRRHIFHTTGTMMSSHKGEQWEIKRHRVYHQNEPKTQIKRGKLGETSQKIEIGTLTDEDFFESNDENLSGKYFFISLVFNLSQYSSVYLNYRNCSSVLELR